MSPEQKDDVRAIFGLIGFFMLLGLGLYWTWHVFGISAPIALVGFVFLLIGFGE